MLYFYIETDDYTLLISTAILKETITQCLWYCRNLAPIKISMHWFLENQF